MAGTCHDDREAISRNELQGPLTNAGPDHTEEPPCPPRSSFPTTGPPTRTTRSPSAASSANAGAEVALAYVRHSQEPDLDREKLAQGEAEELLARGAQLLGDAGRRQARRDRPLDPRGPQRAGRERGRERDRVLLGLAHRQRATSRSATPRSGCSRAAPSPSRSRPSAWPTTRRRPCSRSSRSATPTAARARRPSRSPPRSARASRRSPTRRPDLLVVDSRPEAEQGRVGISASAEHLVEIATSPVLVLPRGVALSFGRQAVAA